VHGIDYLIPKTNMDAVSKFDEICTNAIGATRSVMFGAPCLKTPNGKAAVCLYKNFLVVKVDAETAKEIRAMDGSKTFEPKEGRPMNGWIQVGFEYANYWQEWTLKAILFVEKIEVKPKKPKKIL